MRRVASCSTGWCVVVLAHGQRVVAVDEDVLHPHEGGQAHRIPGVVHKGQEGCGIGKKAPVQGHAIARGGHGELADAPGNSWRQRCQR